MRGLRPASTLGWWAGGPLGRKSSLDASDRYPTQHRAASAVATDKLARLNPLLLVRIPPALADVELLTTPASRQMCRSRHLTGRAVHPDPDVEAIFDRPSATQHRGRLVVLIESNQLRALSGGTVVILEIVRELLQIASGRHRAIDVPLDLAQIFSRN